MADCLLALGPDTAGGLLRRFVAAAARRLDVAVYELGPGYAALLSRAAGRGAHVRVLLDDHAGANSTSAAVLAGSGAQCRVLGGRAGDDAHWKLLVADGDTMATGTGNLLRRDAPEPGRPGTREWWATASRAAGVVAAASAAFEAGWAAATPPPATWRRAVPPLRIPPVGVPPELVPTAELTVPVPRLHFTAGGQSIGALLGERLAAARSRALVTVPYVHTRVAAVRELLETMATRAERGVTTHLLLGTAPDADSAAALAALPSIAVRVMNPARCTTGHAKGAVVDGAALVCSANWSGAGLGGNRESGLLLHDRTAADWFAAALQRDWALADDLSGRPPQG